MENFAYIKILIIFYNLRLALVRHEPHLVPRLQGAMVHLELFITQCDVLCNFKIPKGSTRMKAIALNMRSLCVFHSIPTS